MRSEVLSIHLPDLSIFNLLSVFVLVRRINYYPTHHLYFEEVETPYTLIEHFQKFWKQICKNFLVEFINRNGVNFCT